MSFFSEKPNIKIEFSLEELSWNKVKSIQEELELLFQNWDFAKEGLKGEWQFESFTGIARYVDHYSTNLYGIVESIEVVGLAVGHFRGFDTVTWKKVDTQCEIEVEITFEVSDEGILKYEVDKAKVILPNKEE